MLASATHALRSERGCDQMLNRHRCCVLEPFGALFPKWIPGNHDEVARAVIGEKRGNEFSLLSFFVEVRGSIVQFLSNMK